jgi:hypothetical protein
MKRILITLFAVLALAFANPSATTADKPDNPGQSQQAQNNDKGSDCKKKGCGQPHGQSCKNPNPHKTWCGSGRDGDDDGDGDGDNGNDKDNNAGVLADTGA